MLYDEEKEGIIESTDGVEATINLAPVRFCISMSTFHEFKEQLELLVEKHRI